MSFFWPYVGLIPALITFGSMYFTGFFVSYYINQVTSSAQRATVLSFKGLSLNGAYGLIGILYSLLAAVQRSHIQEAQPKLVGEALESSVFIESFKWFPWYFILMMGLFLIF